MSWSLLPRTRARRIMQTEGGGGDIASGTVKLDTRRLPASTYLTRGGTELAELDSRSVQGLHSSSRRSFRTTAPHSHGQVTMITPRVACGDTERSKTALIAASFVRELWTEGSRGRSWLTNHHRSFACERVTRPHPRRDCGSSGSHSPDGAPLARTWPRPRLSRTIWFKGRSNRI